MVAPSPEPRREKCEPRPPLDVERAYMKCSECADAFYSFIATSELSVDSPRSTARAARPTDAAPQLTEPATLFCILSTASPLPTTPTTSSSILLWI